MVPDAEPAVDRYSWTNYYESFADRLLSFRDRRAELIEIIEELRNEGYKVLPLQDLFSDGTRGLVQDIDPFTIFSIFNRGITDDNRKLNIQALSDKLDIDAVPPVVFTGIPVADNRKSWFFGYEESRHPGDIDNLWDLFAAALELADSPAEESLTRFKQAYDQVRGQAQIKWNITMGLYWIRPWTFVSLDAYSRENLSRLGFSVPKYTLPNADEYWELTSSILDRLATPELPASSLPELSYQAWTRGTQDADTRLDAPKKGPSEDLSLDASNVYTVENIVADGAFISEVELAEMVDVLREKKNIVLQGPPGTGKTWLSNRLAYALLGEKDKDRVKALQFHPNMSYQDFVRGLRPVPGGEFKLTNGPLLRIAEAASRSPERDYVLVIEEINRGNPSQVFGEMLTLLEADKRNPENAIELAYSRDEEDAFYLPQNLHLIGTMNVADRSLALVDVALRRRFAFFNLSPQINDNWEQWCIAEAGLLENDVRLIRERMKELNEKLSQDPSLGPQYRVGHSFVTPTRNTEISNGVEWFSKVVRTEIGPLLEEYWFDNAKQAEEATKALVAGL